LGRRQLIRIILLVLQIFGWVFHNIRLKARKWADFSPVIGRTKWNDDCLALDEIGIARSVSNHRLNIHFAEPLSEQFKSEVNHNDPDI